MRGESRSTSKSPTTGNGFRGGERGDRGDRPPSEPPCNKVYVTFLPEDVSIIIFRFNKVSSKKFSNNVER